MKHVPDTEPELVCHESWIVCAKWHEETRMVHPFLVCVFAFDPRQEPSAVVPLAGICAGGRPQGRSLPRRSARGTRPAQRAPDTEPEPVRQACWTACVGSCWSEPALDLSEEPSAVVPHAGICAGGRPKGRSLPRPSVPVRVQAKR